MTRQNESGPSDRGKVDPRVRRYLGPTRIVWRTPGGVEKAEALLRDGSGQASVWTHDGCVLSRERSGAAGVCLDFGGELYGGLRLTIGQTAEQKPVRLRVRFGESVSEAMGQPDNDHAIHDSVVLAPWAGSVEVGPTGYRFVRIDLAEPEGSVEIQGVQALAVYRDLPYGGDFCCSDERLNSIWRTGARTVHLNMQEYLWDGIKRDRLVWIGDMHPEAAVISVVLGAHDIVPRSLDLVRDETPLPGWMNGISAYSLWWMLIQRHWYLYHGDLGYLREQQDYMLGLLEMLGEQIDDGGRETLPGMRFLDWPTYGDEMVVHAGLQALLVLALDAGAALCGVLGLEEARAWCVEQATRTRAQVPSAGTSKQVTALQVLAEQIDPAKANASVLAREPFTGLSTFYGYYVLEARARAGDYAGALEVIRRYWGGMLDLGATSFWEHFCLDWLENGGRIDELPGEDRVDVHATYGDHCYRGWRHSLCHGWAGGPTAWLTNHVLGLRPLAPGSTRLALEPHLVDLQWAQGTLPTPQGPVSVRLTRRGERTVSEVEAPDGVEIVRRVEE